MELTSENILKILSPDLLPTYQVLKKERNVDIFMNNSASIFAVIFREVFMSNDSDYKLPDGSYGSSRSNLTYTIAYSFLTTAKFLNVDCIFEAEGKRDAVIRTKDASETLLFCEWEWNYDDVFGKGKEIEKLIKSTQKNKTASGFLFTYVPEKSYTEYLRRVADAWQLKKRKYEDPPLILMTVLFDHVKGWREFKTLRTATIYHDNITFWEDKPYQ